MKWFDMKLKNVDSYPNLSLTVNMYLTLFIDQLTEGVWLVEDAVYVFPWQLKVAGDVIWWKVSLNGFVGG